MNIDRYRAMLALGVADELRERVEQLLAEANRAFVDAMSRLARAIEAGDQSNGAGEMRQ